MFNILHIVIFKDKDVSISAAHWFPSRAAQRFPENRANAGFAQLPAEAAEGISGV
jgi:hypothetical protein